MSSKTETVEQQTEMDVLDFLLGINCLSRCGIDQKIKGNKPSHPPKANLLVVMFELCDTDDDGCMNPMQIL